MTFIENLFSTDGEGYLPISRKALIHLIKQIPNPDYKTLYTWMLLEAAFKDDFFVNGIHLAKGCLQLDLNELMKIMKCKRSRAYSIVKSLIDEGLLKKEKQKDIYRLVHYNKHCSTKSDFLVPKRIKLTSPGKKDSFQDSKFDDFFDYYHYELNQVPCERMKTWNEWKKLSDEERELAFANVSKYKISLRKEEHAKYACNYLKDKSYII